MSKKRKYIKEIILQATIIIGVLAIWEILVRINPSTILPTPSASFYELINMLFHGNLLTDSYDSIRRVLVGYLLALVSGFFFGIIFGLFPKINLLFTPIFETLRPIPPIAWIPISLVLFTLGDPSSYFVIFIGAFFPILTNTILGVREVQPIFIEASEVLGASRWQTFVNVILPASLPSVFAGMRVGLGFAWMCVVAAEMIAARSGIGYSIQFNRQMLELDRVVAGMLAIGLIGLAMTKLMLWIEFKLLPWKQKYIPNSNSLTNVETKSQIDNEIDFIGGVNLNMKNVNFSYQSNNQVLKEFSLDIKSGEVISILGPSGCGKTTILRLLSNFEKPTKGDILLDNQPIESKIEDVTIVFQGFSLFPWKTIFGNISYSLKNKKINREEVLTAVNKLLKMVNMPEKTHNYPHQLSGGQQQRVGILRALAYKPKLLLLDEPFAALDSYTRENLQFDVSELIHKRGTTTIMVTHDISEAIYMADKVILLSNEGGKIIKTFNVTVPRPRPLDFRHDKDFFKLHQEIWNLQRD